MTTTTLQPGPLNSRGNQFQRLRHLSQPFFLPLEQASGWQFAWLLTALMFCVGGVVLLVVTGLNHLVWRRLYRLAEDRMHP